MTSAIAAQPHSRHVCKSCGADKLEVIRAFEGLAQVTLDSKPFPAGGRLFVCGQCGSAQKIADERWLKAIGHIYAGNAMHHKSGTPNQVVFDPISGAPAGRCAILSKRVRFARNFRIIPKKTWTPELSKSFQFASGKPYFE